MDVEKSSDISQVPDALPAEENASTVSGPEKTSSKFKDDFLWMYPIPAFLPGFFEGFSPKGKFVLLFISQFLPVLNFVLIFPLQHPDHPENIHYTKPC